MKKKVLENKKKKEENLLKAAFDLLSCKDIQDVSVDEIVGKAGIAKGTFYLYYKDKYAIRDALIQKESASLFTQAFDQLHKNDIRSFEDSVVFVINHVLMQLENNLPILRFIQRNLSYGLLHSRLKKAIDEDTFDEELMERVWRACFCGLNPEQFFSDFDKNVNELDPINIKELDVVKQYSTEHPNGSASIIVVPVE